MYCFLNVISFRFILLFFNMKLLLTENYIDLAKSSNEFTSKENHDIDVVNSLVNHLKLL